MENNVKKKKYIIKKCTFRDLQNLVANKRRYDAQELVKYNVRAATDFETEQLVLQQRNRWYAEITADVRLYGNSLDQIVERTIEKELYTNKLKDKLTQKVHDELMNTEIIITVDFDKQSCTDDCLRAHVSYVTEDEKDDRFEYVEDNKELMGKLKEVKDKPSSYMKEDKNYVYLETLTVRAYPYAFEDIDKQFTKKISKYVREHLTYCLKNDSVIVPEEYLNKGKEGIEEWRTIKSSNNKNNSMEKQMLKQVIREKKEYARTSLGYVMNAVLNVDSNRNWSLPTFMIDGRWNQGKVRKLVAQVLKDKSDQDLLEMSEEEITNMFKEYWKKIINDMLESVDKFDYTKVGK